MFAGLLLQLDDLRNHCFTGTLLLLHLRYLIIIRCWSLKYLEARLVWKLSGTDRHDLLLFLISDLRNVISSKV